MKVYIITDGSYSDYHIEAAFSSKELAEQYIEITHAGDIEEYVLDAPMPLPQTSVIMTKEGKVISTYRTLNQDIGFSYFYSYKDPDDPNMCYIVETASEETAIKVVNEKRIQILALNLWGQSNEVRALLSSTTNKDL